MYCLQTYLYHNCIFRYSQFLIKITSQLSLIHHFHKSNILAWPNDHRNTKWTQKQSDRILKNPTTESYIFQHLKKEPHQIIFNMLSVQIQIPLHLFRINFSINVTESNIKIHTEITVPRVSISNICNLSQGRGMV